jgi:diguanylate cyclase (GGDEF)-like protein
VEKAPVSSIEIDRLYAIAPIGLAYLDRDLRFQYINHWLASINGLPVEAHLGKRFDTLLRSIAARTASKLHQVIETGVPIIDGEVIGETPAHPGEQRCYRHSWLPDKNPSGEIVGVCCIVQDVTARKQAELTLEERNRDLKSTNEELAKVVAELHRANQSLVQETQKAARANRELEKAKTQLKRLAFTDNLTGLGNRSLFQQHLEQLLNSASASDAEVAILVMDLNGFKEINDRLGHAGGDLVLQEFASRLKAVLRQEDRKYRLGGDEFAVLHTQSAGAFNSAAAAAERFAEHMSQPMEVMGHRCNIGVSIGIAVYPDHGLDTEVLVRKADAAMYESKQKGLVLAGASDLGATTVLRNLLEQSD